MSTTLHFNANPKYSLTETILFAIKKLSENSNLNRILIRIDGKYYEINRGDKITDIMENWCRIKFDIEDEINLPFKDDNCKFHFYTILLNKEYFSMTPFSISLAINVDKHIKEKGTISRREFYNMEKCCINIHPIYPTKFLLLPYSTAILKTRDLLKECMAYSDKMMDCSAPVTKSH